MSEDSETGMSEVPDVSKPSSIIPEIYFDIISRFVPGIVLLCICWFLFGVVFSCNSQDSNVAPVSQKATTAVSIAPCGAKQDVNVVTTITRTNAPVASGTEQEHNVKLLKNLSTQCTYMAIFLTIILAYAVGLILDTSGNFLYSWASIRYSWQVFQRTVTNLDTEQSQRICGVFALKPIESNLKTKLMLGCCLPIKIWIYKLKRNDSARSSSFVLTRNNKILKYKEKQTVLDGLRERVRTNLAYGQQMVTKIHAEERMLKNIALGLVIIAISVLLLKRAECNRSYWIVFFVTEFFLILGIVDRIKRVVTRSVHWFGCITDKETDKTR
jgi:hypothetical protein